MVVWDLEDIYLFSDTEKLLAQLEGKVTSFVACRKELTDELSSERFLEIYKLTEEISILCSHLAGYASLAFSADTSGSLYNRLQAVRL